MRRTLFLRWLLVNVLFGSGLAVAKIRYDAAIPGVAWAAITVVLAIFVAGSGYAGWLAWHGSATSAQLQHLERGASYEPKAAMLGTVAGFLIAFSGDTADVAARVRGASTGLAATFIGIAAMLVLELLHHLLEASREAR